MSERGHVIFAEDNEDFRTLLSEGLRFLRFRVTEVVDGASAMRAILASEPPFVILTDLHMPSSSGYDLLAELRHEGMQELLPVVVLTAIPDPQIEGAVLLEKPISLEVLAVVLDEQLRRAAAAQTAARTKLNRLRAKRKA